MAQGCRTCKWWINDYKHSRIVKRTMGTCIKPVNTKKLPFAFVIGWTGRTAVDKTDGTDCPCYEEKRP